MTPTHLVLNTKSHASNVATQERMGTVEHHSVAFDLHLDITQTKSPITFSIARKPSVDKDFALLDDELHVPPRHLHIHGHDGRTHDRRTVLGTRLKT